MTHKKYNIVLDLDNTLLSAVPLEDLKTDKKTKEKMKEFTHYNMDDYYIIFERPGLQKFLDYIFKHFNVSIFTLASKSYALWIVDNIILKKDKPKRKVDYIFFSYHSNWSKSKSSNKNLKSMEMLWTTFGLDHQFNSNNTFIIDDLPEINKTQPCNSIKIKAFEFEDEDSPDDEELKILKKRLKKLIKLKDEAEGEICLTETF